MKLPFKYVIRGNTYSILDANDERVMYCIDDSPLSPTFKLQEGQSYSDYLEDCAKRSVKSLTKFHFPSL